MATMGQHTPVGLAQAMSRVGKTCRSGGRFRPFRRGCRKCPETCRPAAIAPWPSFAIARPQPCMFPREKLANDVLILRGNASASEVVSTSEMFQPRANRITREQTVAAIVDRSSGVCWTTASSGLVLIRARAGYVLVAETRPSDDVLGERVVPLSESGHALPDGHILTARERECAVRTILGLQ
jgi:hypothetical protein